MMEKQNLIEFVKKDFIYIVLLLFAVIACLYTLGEGAEINKECNEHWIKEFEDKQCTCGGMTAVNALPVFKNLALPSPDKQTP